MLGYKNQPDLTVLFTSIQMCNQLFKYLINHSASAGDKNVTGRTDSYIRKPIISVTFTDSHVVFDVACSCHWLPALVWCRSLCRVSWYLEPWSFHLFYFSSFNLVWRICSSACLSPSVCILPFLLSVYWPLLSVSLLICLPCCPLTSPPVCLTPIYFLYLYRPITRLHIHTCLP